MADLKIEDYSLQLGGGKGFFTLKLSGQPWTNWVPVSPAEIAAINEIISSGRAEYDYDKGILKLPSKGVYGLVGEESQPPVLDFESNSFPKKPSK